VPQVFFCGCPLYLVLAAMLAVRSTIILVGIVLLGTDSVCVISSSDYKMCISGFKCEWLHKTVGNARTLVPCCN
jgi:hypothetical protein